MQESDERTAFCVRKIKADSNGARMTQIEPETTFLPYGPNLRFA